MDPARLQPPRAETGARWRERSPGRSQRAADWLSRSPPEAETRQSLQRTVKEEKERTPKPTRKDGVNHYLTICENIVQSLV